MNLKGVPRKVNARLELLDTMMDSYLHWRDANRAVTESYRNWGSAARPDRDVAFDQYVAALDREERAAWGYWRVVEQTERT